MSAADPATLIAEKFAAVMEEFSAGLKTALPYEPGTVERAKLPLLSMFALLPQGIESDTGPGEDVDFAWEVNLYISLRNWQDAQQQMSAVATEVVNTFRAHRLDFDDLDLEIYERSLRRSVGPTPAEDHSYLRAAWELSFSVRQGL